MTAPSIFNDHRQSSLGASSRAENCGLHEVRLRVKRDLHQFGADSQRRIPHPVGRVTDYAAVT
jgi:hypothetical protein